MLPLNLLTGNITGGMVKSGFSFTKNGWWVVTGWASSCSVSSTLPLLLSSASFSSCNFLQKAVNSAIVFPPALLATLTCCDERLSATGLSGIFKALLTNAVFTLWIAGGGTSSGNPVFSFDFDFDLDRLLVLLLFPSLETDFRLLPLE